MRFTTYFTTAAMALFSTLTLAAAAGEETSTDQANPISQPLANAVLTAGAAFTIEWLPTAGKIVTLALRKGKDPKSLDTLEVIASNLPNSGVFIWVPSTQLAGGDDYAIQVTSSDPNTSNYSAKFRIISNGPGIKGTTVEPSTTRTVGPSPLHTGIIPTYTGAEITTTDNAAAPAATTESSGAANEMKLCGFVAAVFVAVAGGAAVLV